jgi:hypothetical protein
MPRPNNDVASYVISYNYTGDTRGKEYHALLTEISSLNGWRFLDEACVTVMVESTLNAGEVYEQLIDYFTEPDDKLLVAEIFHPAWYNLKPAETAIRRRLGPESRHPKATHLPETA